MFRELIKKLIPQQLFRVIEPYGHLLEAVLANLYYGFPAKNLKVIGVTGTDGKTTTCTMIAAMLRDAGLNVGLLTTVSIDIGQGAEPNPTRLTTMTSFQVMKNLKRMKDAGLDWVVLETTSHALAQNRVWGVPYSIAVMTNVTHEHLDYHGTIERYRAAKLKLFKLTNRNRAGLRTGIVNADDPSAKLFCAAVRQCVTYGIQAGDVKAVEIESSAAGSQINAVASWEGIRETYNLSCNLPGRYNVYNALAAAAVGEVLGFSAERIEQGIGSLKTVEGRMNVIDEGQDFTVIVDYAHTPDSFEKVMAEIKPLTKGRLIAVFGSAGRRDEAKRPLQGEVAGRYCDIVVVTEEDDRDVDGLAILHEIADGAKKAGKVFDKTLFLIHDRSQAINQAMKLAEPGDTILLLGKGHEKSILTNKGKKDWDEVGEARKAISGKPA